MKEIILSVFIISSLIGCSDKREHGTVQRAEVSGITLEKVRVEEVPGFYRTSGTVKADTLSIISSKVMGTVTSIQVRNGDRVEKGQLLLTIDDSDVLQKVRAAEAASQAALNGRNAAAENFKLAESTYIRFRKLFEENALTQQEMNEVETKKNIAYSQLQQAEAARNQSEAALSEARVYLGYTRIKAPVKGIVSEKKIDVGTMAAPGMHLITIEDPSYYVITVNVDERLFRSLKKEMAVNVSVDSLGLDLTGIISEIAQAIDPVTRTFQAKILVKNRELRSGFYATVSIPAGKARTVLVPESSIVERGQLRGVYVVDSQGVIHFRLIKTGRTVGTAVEVLSGLAGSETVISDGIMRAVDGGIVKDADMPEERPVQ